MLELKELKISDAKTLVKWNEDKDEAFLFQWAGMSTYIYPITVDQINKLIQAEDETLFKIEDQGTMVGIVKVTKPDGQKDYVRFGHLLISEDYRGRGYGSQAIHLIEDLAFNVYRVKYLELGVFSFNQKAKRLYERLGYEVVGVRKDDKDSNFDSYTMRKSRDA